MGMPEHTGRPGTGPALACGSGRKAPPLRRQEVAPPLETDATSSGDLTKGMAQVDQSNPAYRATYLECLQKRGYSS